jgi:hypothetical protein
MEDISDIEAQEALIAINRPTQFKYPLLLKDNTFVELPCHPCGHAEGLQAQKGEQYIDTGKDKIDPGRSIRMWVRRINMGLDGGWKIVNDLMAAPEPPKGDIANKEIPVSLIMTDDWVTLEAMIFPGSELDRESIKARINAIRRKYG